MKEKKARVEDAMHATKAAVEEGIVTGGGTTFLRAANAIGDLEDSDIDINHGIKIIRGALEEPIRQIARNCGQEGAIVLNNVRNASGAQGYNAATDTYEDLIEAGVIDPAKVVKHALMNAASVASMMLTTQATVTEIESDDPPMPPRRRRHGRLWAA